MQIAITAILIIAAVAYFAVALYKTIRGRQRCNYGCKDCPIKEKCNEVK